MFSSFLIFAHPAIPILGVNYSLGVIMSIHKTEVESLQLGNTYIADMDKCPQDKCCLDKCRGDSCSLLYMFPGPFV